ncbi:TPA: hypothetical protein DGT35_01170, partial [Patescibacteria group bacterium]|nr:hypothetical protein [Patescibacteria group bacterium]
MSDSQETSLFKSPKRIIITVISVGLISLLFAVAINPVEFVRFHRDRKRTQDLKSLSSFISQIEEKAPEAIKAESKIIYTSLPDNDPDCSKWLKKGLPEIASGYKYRCQTESDYLKNDGSGWVPIDFTALGSEAPYKLVKDPQNGKKGRDPDSGEKVVFYYQYLFG